jgi:predicted RNA binding protein YcfA (HicA-like mRNA interferase family)
MKVFSVMTKWRSVKAKQLLAALLRIGWEVAWQKGSHRRLKRLGWPRYKFAFHDIEELGPGLLAQIGKKTLRAETTRLLQTRTLLRTGFRYSPKNWQCKTRPIRLIMNYLH